MSEIKYCAFDQRYKLLNLQTLADEKGCDTCITFKLRSARGVSLCVPMTMTPTWNGASRGDKASDTCTPGWALSLLHSRDT